MSITLSTLPHTWLIDVDGTMLKHNGHKNDGDELLPGVSEFWRQIPDGDVIILLSARTEDEKKATLDFLRECGLRFDRALFGLPVGERVLINDGKPRGLATALAVNIPRDVGLVGLQVRLERESTFP